MRQQHFIKSVIFRACFGTGASLCLMFSCMQALCSETITPEGRRLSRFLDSLNVEKLWLPQTPVNWETGKPATHAKPDGKLHTHCSAFVAAVAKQLGIYILRPPKHKQNLLANAQYDWLDKHGSDYNWWQDETYMWAQNSANEGHLVVAVYKEPNSKHPGHIAILRPCVKCYDQMAKEGPQIIQAGLHNYNSTTTKHGFKNHKNAWKDGDIMFYTHFINWNKVELDCKFDAIFNDGENADPQSKGLQLYR